MSVVVPVHDGEETLAEFLTAITTQEGYELERAYEVIVVDDGSKDKTAEIAQSFPVQVISLGINMGRIVARETGARAARFDRLLLLDSRVVANHDLLSTYAQLGKVICMAGDLGEREAAEESVIDRMYFCLRKKYYGKHYPQQDRILEVTEDNFSEVPKGTTCIFVDRDTFLNAIPDQKGKTVNDDVKLLQDIVFRQGKHFYRSLDLKVRYLQRRSLGRQVEWLIDRGVRFADYLLSTKVYYLLAYLASLSLIPILLCAFWTTPIVAVVVLTVLFVLFLALVAQVAESLGDFAAFAPLVLTIAFFFWWGVNKGVAGRIGSRLCAFLKISHVQP